MCHVLVIENDFLLADHMTQLIATAGGDSFDHASDAAEALASAARRRPDLIVSEVRLAQGDGRAAVAAILREHGAIPVMFVTGTPDARIPDAYSGAAPRMAILTKPVADDDLVATFRRLADG